MTQQTIEKYPSLKAKEREITDSLLNGESEILKLIAGNIQDFVGNWDAVCDVSVDGSREVKEITIEDNYSYRETVTVQPFEVLLIEISKQET